MTDEVPVTPPAELVECSHGCGAIGLKGASGDAMHYKQWCPENPDVAAVAAKRTEAQEQTREVNDLTGPKVASKRGLARKGFNTKAATVMEQIRPRPGGLIGGPASYFLNPKGATVAEALIIYPSGAPIYNNAGREVGNAVYRQQRMKERGFEYVGPTLTMEAGRRLVGIIESNRPDFLLDLREQMADCDHDIQNNDRPEVRDNQRRRKIQLSRLFEQTRVPLDADALVKELDEIVQAHKLAAVPRNMRDAIAAIAGEVASKHVLSMVGQLEGGTQIKNDEVAVTVTNAAAGDEF